MYENSRFLKNRFTFCGVNTNFGQQLAPPAYYHLTPIVSEGKHWKLCYFRDSISAYPIWCIDLSWARINPYIFEKLPLSDVAKHA